MRAVHRLHAQAQADLLGGGMSIGLARISGPADLTIQDDPYWATVLQTEEGEPFEREQDRAFLEHI